MSTGGSREKGAVLPTTIRPDPQPLTLKAADGHSALDARSGPGGIGSGGARWHPAAMASRRHLPRSHRLD